MKMCVQSEVQNPHQNLTPYILKKEKGQKKIFSNIEHSEKPLGFRILCAFFFVSLYFLPSTNFLYYHFYIIK